MRRSLLLALFLLAVPCAAMGDIVVLKDGTRTEGVVTERENELRVDLEYGSVIIPKRLVDHVIFCDTPRQQYEKKLAAIDKRNTEKLKALQQWCTENGLEKEAKELALTIGRLVLEEKSSTIDAGDSSAFFNFALWCRRNGYEERIVESYLWKVLGISPDHTAAREMLGYRKFRGQWLKKAEIDAISKAELDKEMRLKGLVKYDGQWLTPNAADCLEQLRYIEEQREELEHDRQQVEDESRELAHERIELQAQRNSVYLEESRLKQLEDRIEHTALTQAALAQRLAIERSELNRQRARSDGLREDLDLREKEIREEWEKVERERCRLQQLRHRLDCEWSQLRREKAEIEAAVRERNAQEIQKPKIGSEEHTSGRRLSSKDDGDPARRERVRR